MYSERDAIAIHCCFCFLLVLSSSFEEVSSGRQTQTNVIRGKTEQKIETQTGEIDAMVTMRLAFTL